MKPRRILGKIVSKLPGWKIFDRAIITADYYRQFRRTPKIDHPQRFNDKIQHRKLYDRNPLLTQLQDKYLAREYVAARVGEKYLPEIYGVFTDPTTVDFEALPDRFVFKANHGCKWNIFVRNRDTIDPEAIRKISSQWLKRNYYLERCRAWAYNDIRPLLMAEEFLSDRASYSFPLDYKFRCFNGMPTILLVTKSLDEINYVRLGSYELKNGQWKRISTPIYKKETPVVMEDQELLPANIDEMPDIARQLADGIDYIRVDMYNLQGRIIFGEFTLYDGSGYLPILDNVDFAWGQLWKMSS